jgi:hypothetical protein
MADRLSARRASLTTLPFTANTALFTILSTRSAERIFWLIALGGIIFSLSWWLLPASYRQLTHARYQVIGEMEKNLEAQLFIEERKKLSEQRKRIQWVYSVWRYGALGAVERVVPLCFAALYMVAFVTVLL